MRRPLVIVPMFLLAVASPAPAQRRFPPDSLTNVKVFAKNTPVTTVIGSMRNFAGWLGVRCQYCHVGREGMPLDSFDFASDEKDTKKTAREMMRMVETVNGRLANLPTHAEPHVEVTCQTCHRGVARPVPLPDLLAHELKEAGRDSAVRVYRALRTRYYGSAAYDFSEQSLNLLAGRLSRGGQADDALAMVELNAEFYPTASSVVFTRGEVLLARRDTAGAVVQYRRAVEMDGNPSARQRLNTLAR